jgi:transposase
MTVLPARFHPWWHMLLQPCTCTGWYGFSSRREALHRWLLGHVERVSGASDLAKAMRYALRHWPGLVAFLDDGRIEMDTNVVERAIRPHVLTRKNALFAGSDGGARHWAIAMTLIQTAKLNGVDPQAWLTDALERVVSGRTKSHELHTLLPWTWQKQIRAEPELLADAAA